MSVLIKDVDKDLYARFKAAAALRKLKLNEALYEAMKKWIDDESPETEVDRDRLLNNATYRQLIPDLLERHRGKWVVISTGELIGIYPDQKAAINAVKEAGIVHRCNIVSPITDRKRKVSLGFGRKLI